MCWPDRHRPPRTRLRQMLILSHTPFHLQPPNDGRVERVEHALNRSRRRNAGLAAIRSATLLKVELSSLPVPIGRPRPRLS